MALTPRERLLKRYEQTREHDPDITTGRFMMEARPDIYRNEQSGARAFRKLRNNETTGRRIFRNENYVEHWYTAHYYDESGRWRIKRNPDGTKVYDKRYERPRGGYQKGLWWVTVQYTATDRHGDEIEGTGSYLQTNPVLDTNLDAPLVMAIAYDKNFVNKKIVEWAANPDYEISDINIVSISVKRVERGKKTPFYMDVEND